MIDYGSDNNNKYTLKRFVVGGLTLIENVPILGPASECYDVLNNFKDWMIVDKMSSIVRIQV